MNTPPLIKVSETIGIIDSGVGGLSILNSLVSLLPSHTFVYVADAAHLPYGQKSPDYLLERAIRITHFLQTKGISTIFVACHTLSATVLSDLRPLFPTITYIDMVPGTVEKAAALTKNNRIGIMATTATIASHMHKKLLKSVNPALAVYEQACPLFVELIEKKAELFEINTAISLYLDPLIKEDVDTIILGCTHYPFIQSHLEEKAPHVKFVSAANAFPQLVFQKTEPKASTIPSIHFITSASGDYLSTSVERYFAHAGQCVVTYSSKPEL